MRPNNIGLLIAVSPGEAELAADSLQRAIAKAPGPCDVFVVNNGGIADAAQWCSIVGAEPHRFRVFIPDGLLPRPYFEIARTIFGALAEIAARPPELLFKIDPDTVVLDSGFFADVGQLHREDAADCYACKVKSSPRDHRRRCARLLLDLAPLGLRRDAGSTRYGRNLNLRVQPVWYWRILLSALCRGGFRHAMQPSGGFYVVCGGILSVLKSRRLLSTRGANGLEWNDDSLLPLAVRAAGGKVSDIRKSRFAPGWRWLHGSCYFNNEQAFEPGLRALHPVKSDADGRLLRDRLGRATGTHA